MTERRQILSAAGLGLAVTAAVSAAAQDAAVGRPLTGKTALVTGAARGIGRATAVALARQGADVALLDIADPDAVPALKGYRLASRVELDEAVNLVRAEGVRALPLVADIRRPEAMREAAATLTQALGGGPDILVANAGIAIDGPLTEPDPAAWQALQDVNLTGTLNTVQAALPGMRRGGPGGRIIIVTSVQARMGVARSGGYAVTKWGLTGLMKSLAAQLGAEEIKVNAVAPTAVETAMIHRGGSGGGAADPRKAATEAGHTLPIPVLPPEAIADAIVFLAGPGAAFVSGMTLDVNAGRSAHLTA
jgi:NAD(P)-dependent dehydrogenase (short-subunit alcohol dehydrogenase family)